MAHAAIRPSACTVWKERSVMVRFVDDGSHISPDMLCINPCKSLLWFSFMSQSMVSDMLFCCIQS